MLLLLLLLMMMMMMMMMMHICSLREAPCAWARGVRCCRLWPACQPACTSKSHTSTSDTGTGENSAAVQEVVAVVVVFVVVVVVSMVAVLTKHLKLASTLPKDLTGALYKTPCKQAHVVCHR
jgi:hypothetical protein